MDLLPAAAPQVTTPAPWDIPPAACNDLRAFTGQEPRDIACQHKAALLHLPERRPSTGKR
jgi:hypothetical protein